MIGAWPEVQIADVAELIRGVTYAKDDARSSQEDGFLPLLRATNIQDASLILETELVFVPEAKISTNQILRAGDIVLATSSGSKHLVGKSALLRREWTGSFGAFCAAIRPKENIVPKYLASFLQSPAYWKQIGEKSMGVNINNLRRGDIESVVLPLPNLDEQRRIVAEIEKQFSRLDEAVANLQRVKANLKRYKASVLKAAVEGRLVETEASIAQREGRSYETGEQLLQRILEERRAKWAGRGKYKQPESPVLDGLDVLPEGWTYATTEQMCEQIASGSTPPPDAMFSGAGDVPFLKVYNLTFDCTLDFTVKPTYVAGTTHKGLLARSRSIPGDVLMNIVGPPLGKVSIIPPIFPEWNINQAIVTFRTLPGLVNRLLAHWLLAQPVLSRLERTAKATAGQHNLQVSTCRKLPIPIPPLAEQVRIVAELDRHLSSIHGVEAEVDTNLQRAQALRQAALAKAFDMNKPQQISAKTRESNQDA